MCCCVAQYHVYARVFKGSVVHSDSGVFQVHTAAFYAECAHEAFDLRVAYQPVGVEFAMPYAEAFYVYLLFKKRQHGYVDAYAAGVEQGVTLLLGKRAYYGQVERKSQAHAFHAQCHACFF